jgi:hypothetical protein
MASDLVLFLTERTEVEKAGGGTCFVRSESTGRTNVKLKRTDDPGTVLNGIEITGSNGFYKFTGFTANHNWKLYVDDIERATYGADHGRFEASDDLISSCVKLNPGTEQVISGINVFNGPQQQFKTPLYLPPLPSEPPYGNSLVWKQYMQDWVNEQIANMNTEVYQYSPNILECFPGAVEKTGRVYSTIKKCADYAQSQIPTDLKQFLIEIKGTGLTSKLITAEPGSMKAYVNWYSRGHHINIIVGDNSLSANMHIHNAVLYFGSGNISTDRTFKSVKFHNCRIYNYRNITFNECQLDRCTIVSADGYGALLQGAGISWTDIEGCMFNTEPDFIGGIDNYGGVVNYAVSGRYVIPPDPTIPT